MRTEATLVLSVDEGTGSVTAATVLPAEDRARQAEQCAVALEQSEDSYLVEQKLLTKAKEAIAALNGWAECSFCLAEGYLSDDRDREFAERYIAAKDPEAQDAIIKEATAEWGWPDPEGKDTNIGRLCAKATLSRLKAVRLLEDRKIDQAASVLETDVELCMLEIAQWCERQLASKAW